MVNMHFLPNHDISSLEKILVKDGAIQPVSFSDIADFPQEVISAFCHAYGIYQIPTTELIDFLSSEIPDSEDAIEIGAGNGCIGRALGIKMTDNKMQLWDNIKEYYKRVHQPIVKYGQDVEEIDANAAVLKYKPKIVVGCWITEKWNPGMTSGNAWGVEEYKMFGDGIQKYIMVGNSKIHGHKKILSTLHVKKYKFPWILSRSLLHENNNIIYIFTN